MVDFNRQIGAATAPQFTRTSPVMNAEVEYANYKGQQDLAYDLADAQNKAAQMEAMASGATSFFNAFDRAQAASKKSKSDATVGTFGDKLAAIVDAADTDPSINVEKAQRQLRKEYSAAHPELADDINKTYFSVTGKRAAEMTQSQTEALRVEAEARKTGYVVQGMTEEEVSNGVRSYEKSLQSTARLKELETQGKLDKERFVKQELPDLVSLQTETVNNVGASVLRRVSAGEMTVADAKIAFGRMKVDMDSAISSFGPMANNEDVAFSFKPLRDRIQLMEDLATGKIDSDAAALETTRIENTEKLIYMSDPKRARLAAASKLVGPDTISILAGDPALTTVMGDYLLGKETVNPDTPEKSAEPKEQSVQRDYNARWSNPEGVPNKQSTPVDVRNVPPSSISRVKENAEKVIAGEKGSNETQTAFMEVVNFVDDTLNHALRNSEDYDAQDWVKVMNSVPMGNTRSALPAGLDSKYEEMFRRFYGDHAVRLVDEVFNNNTVNLYDTYSQSYGQQVQQDKHILDVADFAVTPQGITLSPKAEYKSNYKVRSAVNSANSKLAATIIPAARATGLYHGQNTEDVLNQMIVPYINQQPTAPQEEQGMVDKLGQWYNQTFVEPSTGVYQVSGPRGMFERSGKTQVTPMQPEPAPIPEANMPQLSPAMERTMGHENNKSLPMERSGWNKETQLWTPHKSLEGGTDTLAYGHKLTSQEVKSGEVKIGEEAVAYAQGITDPQAVQLFHQDWTNAQADAEKFVKAELPPEIKDVVTEMSYQMGLTSLNKFKKFKSALESGDYNKAADEMLDSKWAKSDAPNRAKTLSDIVRSFGG